MMNNDKLVSIAMATYNGEKYLREQLDSIYNQTYKNIEVVVCDDCSTDSTVTILEEYKEKYGLKYFINEKNLGYSKNFEKAAFLCKGEYIAFSDQDDIWLPEKIEILINEIGLYSLIHSNAGMIDKNGTLLNKNIKSNLESELFTGNSFKKIANISIVRGCTILCKKDLVIKAAPIPPNEPHDWWFAIVASRTNDLTYLDKELMFWRKHNSVTNRSFFENLITRIYLLTGANLYRQIRLIKRDLILKKRGL